MRLELTRRGDYAIRAALALADANPSVRTGRQIADNTGIPPTFLAQVMGDLVRAGLARSLTGRRGGYQLGVDPGAVSLLSVVEAVEGPSRRTTCVLRGGRCGADGEHCRVHDAFFAAQESLRNELAAVSLADLGSAKG
jgi:Rrf2 family protein